MRTSGTRWLAVAFVMVVLSSLSAWEYGPGGVQPAGLSVNPRTQHYPSGGTPDPGQPKLVDYVKMSGLLDGSVAPEDSRVWLMNSLQRSTAQATPKFDVATCCDTIMSEGEDTLLNHPVVTGQQISADRRFVSRCRSDGNLLVRAGSRDRRGCRESIR